MSPESRKRAGGTITGYVLRLARESIPATQSGLAERLGVDLATMQGWESGRRPLMNMKAGALLDLRRRLPAIGADPVLVHLMDAAMDADRVITSTLDPPGGSADQHPLAVWVHTRATAHMIAWSLNGTPPRTLPRLPPPRRRGAVPPGPVLTAAEREEFFENLRATTESAHRAGDSAPLLRRQALYLASYDRGPGGSAWTAHALHARRGVLSSRGWTPHWPEARSTATALARQGDPQPLIDFIDRALVDDDVGEAANLNYWAYWLGAAPGPQADDRFMHHRDPAWDPITLLRLLITGLHEAPGYIDLYVHSLWALLHAHPWLPQAVPSLVTELDLRAQRLLDGGRISGRSRRELEAVHYLLQKRS
ncbi:helix-turn-helix domain-containing protein [Streptomyces alkaliphilus]|uniref:helix-turn-helix domain-containing protein n=1 Tax=Streptomyces alkaliphilus TaxID=1472722 RepID=UPI00117F510E|nr:helix-turn-helix transcriptional regulator [Streptomyces alkaliphilus]MQS07335.1 XRE family transcriptional regulator [Streptomyces alkaliphilus]